jgi:cell division protein FtsW (lipid II flippase)
MQAATMTRGMVMTDTVGVDYEAARQFGRRLAIAALIAVGVVATVWILVHMGSLAVYGLPAPFIRRVPVRVAEAV